MIKYIFRSKNMKNHALTIAHLQSIQKKGKNSDQRIASFILNNPEKLYKLTLNDMAEEINVSYATLCRFFKKLDISGFKAFKQTVINELTKKDFADLTNPEDDMRMNPHQTFAQIMGEICDFAENVVRQCEKTISPTDIEMIAEVLSRADFLYFVGLGTSAISAQYAYTKFFRIMPSCAYDNDIIIAKMKASVMTEKNVLFVVSSSGRTKSILEIAKIAKENGATVISLSDFSVSSLANIADINISTTLRESNKYIDTDFPHIQGHITIIDILYSCLYKYTYRHSDRSYKKTVEAIGNDKEKY